ncbi:MAG: hypothetical protein ABSB84_05730 [Verrucomicrobiota bacterium]
MIFKLPESVAGPSFGAAPGWTISDLLSMLCFAEKLFRCATELTLFAVLAGQLPSHQTSAQ